MPAISLFKRVKAHRGESDLVEGISDEQTLKEIKNFFKEAGVLQFCLETLQTIGGFFRSG